VELACEGAVDVAVQIALAGQVELHRQHPLGTEPEVGVDELAEPLDHQAGPGE
jgi:hypothetical protein